MRVIECQQNEPEWFAARLGKVTSSNMEKIISPTGKESTQAEKYMNQILAEIITGESAERVLDTPDIRRGKELEPQAADYYAMTNEVELQTVGFCVTDDDFLGCSPDRLIGDDGLLEIKTGAPHVMVEYILSGKLEQDHRPQTQSALYVTGRKWCDTMLYHPSFKPIIIRSERNEPFLSAMVEYLTNFRTKLETKKAKLKTLGYLDGA